ncbi:PEP-CTERM sorting domain-containing protein [Thalassoglobus sp.]|uniref:PEP-CTERM sorting domain-containing protein n=1 Tax=Thalassoglobus sp. TaxID=2795869 RepID=UPI003AA85D6A
MNLLLNSRALAIGIVLVCFGQTTEASFVSINGNLFDTDQFSGATVTYRADGSVTFDGKEWDNAAGVGNLSLAELASGQYGGDPGDQISLNDRATPDWLQLNYAGSGIELSSAMHNLVIYEISSASSGVDTEGLSFRVQFNNDSTWHAASDGVATFFDGDNLSSSAENTNQIVFDLLQFGFNAGDLLQTIRIENIDSGSSTSDPDFIFMGLSSSPVPEPSSIILLGICLLSFFCVRRQRALAN